MEPRPLTTWEQKERDGLLALETDAWRQKRRIAEDPNTTADILARLFDDLIAQWKKQGIAGDGPGSILAEAIAAHPNTPPSILSWIVHQSSLTGRAFRHNPIAPFLLIEQPDFVGKLTEVAQDALLHETNPLPVFVQMLVANGGAARSKQIQRAAQLHIVSAGEVTTHREWIQQLCDYWREVCATTTVEREQQQIAELAELGLVPSWALSHPPIPIELFRTSFDFTALEDWFRFEISPDSAEAASLLQTISSALFFHEEVKEHRTVLVRALGRDATSTDLRALLQTHPNRLLIAEVILRHPAADAVIKRETVTGLLKSEYAQVRRFARFHPDAPSDASDIARRTVLQQFYTREPFSLSRFILFAAGVHSMKYLHELRQNDLLPPADNLWYWQLYKQASGGEWTWRLEAALLAEVSDTPMPRDPFKRTGRDLLNHLAHDGNRLVRWAAQTRLADPHFVFTWHDGETETA